MEVNCATLRGDQAMPTLFGHVKGVFTGATRDRPGILRTADNGIVFLDEIGELNEDEQAMLLRALEEKRFLPVGADKEIESDFQLIAGTNRNLLEDVRMGRFREDLLARNNLWTFRLPGLAQRREDIEPNLSYELEQYAANTGTSVRFGREVRNRFHEFARAPDASWNGNVRDLNAAMTRMATLSASGRISTQNVEDEIHRLRSDWSTRSDSPDQRRQSSENETLEKYLDREAIAELDLFDRAQLVTVLQACEQSRSLAEAARRLFNVTRTRRRGTNDSDRVRKYLHRFKLHWREIVGKGYNA